MTKLPDYTRGDTFDALTINCSFKDTDGDPTTPPGTFVSAKLVVNRMQPKQGLLKQFTTGDSTLTYSLVGNVWRFVTAPAVLHSSYIGPAEWFLVVTYTDSGVTKTRTFASGSLSIRRGAVA